MKTYPHMNELIVGILRLDDDSPHDLYAAQLIEELQAQLAAKEAQLKDAEEGLKLANHFMYEQEVLLKEPNDEEIKEHAKLTHFWFWQSYHSYRAKYEEE